MQAVQLGYLPRVVIDHTSPREIGQVYVSAVNWGLMAACVGLVLAFRSSTNLAAAYGVAVTTTMVITTLLLHIMMRERWGWSRTTANGLTALFLTVDLAFFSANIVKVPVGGWVPLVVGAGVFTLMTTWKRGRELLVASQRGRDLSIERFIGSISEHPQERVAGTAVYLIAAADSTPPALLSNLRLNEVIHSSVVVVTVQTAPVPRIPQARRSAVHVLGEGFTQVILRYGFFERPNVPRALSNIVHADFGFDPTDATYILGRETVIPTDKTGMAPWREHLFAALHRNASSAVRYFQLPPDQVVEIGTQLEI